MQTNTYRQRIADCLIEKARYSKGHILRGEGTSGKTRLINCPDNKSGLVIQESEELFSDVHPDLIRRRQKIRYDSTTSMQ